MKQKIQKYSGVLLVGAVVIGGVANAAWDFSSISGYGNMLPTSDVIKTGAVIKADDILALSTALGTLDARTAEGCATGEFMQGFNSDGTKICKNLAAEIAALNPDQDGDGIPDSWEQAECTTTAGDCDPTADLDSDGLNNLQEYQHSTKAENADTDGDTVNDGQEISDGTNPIDGSSFLSGPVLLPSGITIAALGDKIIASVHDDNYIPLANPTGNDDVLVDVQGTVTTAGTTLKLAYEVTGSSVDIPAFTQTVNVPADKTEDGQARDVTLSYPAQTLAVGSGNIIATLKAETATLNAKKLDIDQNYQPANWLTLAEFTIALDATNTAPVKLQAIPGIPDAKFGDGEHDFLYMPVVAADGTTWLNNELGAEYNNVHSAHFNPVQQPTATDDYLAYGSLFQWGRPADGHELRTCTSGAACTRKYGAAEASSMSSSLTPSNNLFQKSDSDHDYDWTTTDSDGSQRTAFLSKTDGTGIRPAGYRVPSETELEAALSAENITDEASYLASVFKGVLSGSRSNHDALLYNLGDFGSLWSSTVAGTYSRHLDVYSSSQSWSSTYRAYGFSVRCVED